MKQLIQSLCYRLKKYVRESRCFISGLKCYFKNRSKNNQLPIPAYDVEFKKYLKYMKNEANKRIMYGQMREVLTSTFELKSDRLLLSDDPTDPVIVVVVRNEKERMKLFLEHYRRIGVRQYVVIDNGSDDGTLEYLAAEDGVRVYQVLEEYWSSKRDAWCEKILAMTGYNRWYISVDSDELLDYIGSEQHPIQEMIRKNEEYGNKRILGYMIDMYSEEPLFTPKQANISISDYMQFFDPTGYYLSDKDEPEVPIIKDVIYGGPRYRQFGVKSWLSKQAVFFFERDTLYQCSHYLYPYMKFEDIPVYYVLRHYKYLSVDREEYERRISKGNFAGQSKEYKNIMGQIGETKVNFFHPASKSYVDSNSLRGLPYLKEVDW